MSARDVATEEGFEKHDAFRFENVGDEIEGVVERVALVNLKDGGQKVVMEIRDKDGKTWSVWESGGNKMALARHKPAPGDEYFQAWV